MQMNLYTVEKALADEINFLFYIFFYFRDPLDRDRVELLYVRYFPDIIGRKLNKWRPLVEDKLEINTEVGKYRLPQL